MKPANFNHPKFDLPRTKQQHEKSEYNSNLRLAALEDHILNIIYDDHMPDELLHLPRWLLWKYFQRTGQTKPTKVPYYVDVSPRQGTLDSPEDIARLATFDEAVSAARSAPGVWAGVGLAVVFDGGVGGIDLDKCLDADGNFTDETAEIIYESAKANGCYCEVSPSGNGIRIIGKSGGFQNLNRSGIEAYCYKRFLTITGNCRDNPKGFGSVDTTIALINKLVPGGQQGTGQRQHSKLADLSTGGYEKPDQVAEGGRNDAVLKHVGYLRGIGTPEAAVLDAARDFNTARCKPPLDDDEVEQIAGRYAKPDAATVRLDVDGWPEPTPITAALKPVPSFDLDLLPEKFKPYVADVADLMRTPPDFVAVSLMVAAAATLGNGWAIAPKVTGTGGGK